VVFPDTPHGLFCHRRETFREIPAEDAWNRVRELLAAAFVSSSSARSENV
jgi:hypothetical protein